MVMEKTPEHSTVTVANETGLTVPETTPEPWEEFLEDDADCCGGCDHKPR